MSTQDNILGKIEHARSLLPRASLSVMKKDHIFNILFFTLRKSPSTVYSVIDILCVRYKQPLTLLIVYCFEHY